MTRILPRYFHDMAKIWTKSGKYKVKIWPRYDQDMVKIWSRYGQNIAWFRLIWTKLGDKMAYRRERVEKE